MNNIIKHKGFSARIEFSADDNVFFGRILGIDDIVTFEAASVDNLRSEMRGTIEFYLESCAKRGKAIKKPYNGKLLFRFSSELHAEIALAAQKKGKSINEFGKEVFELVIK
jgi:predicted HicB family RNase H-like nuclease